MTLHPDFSAFLSTLAEAEVEYLLVGGYAVGHYGYVRATADIDVWVRPTQENAARVVDALVRFGFGVPGLREDAFLDPAVVTRMGIPPFRIEILSSISGVAFEDCWPGRVEDEWDGVPVTVIGLDCLKANKRATGRPKDAVDVSELEAVEGTDSASGRSG